MRIEDTGFSLTPHTDIYRENRTRAEEPENARAAGASFSDALLRAGKVPAAGRTDKIEISRRPEESGSAPNEIGDGIRREISGDADAARLESLKRRVGSGSYDVDPEELARVLLTGVGKGKGNHGCLTNRRRTD